MTFPLCQRIKVSDARKDGLLRAWGSAFPSVDLEKEILKADAWLLANNRHMKNYGRFLQNWLAKASEQPAIKKAVPREVYKPSDTTGLGKETPPEEAAKRIAELLTSLKHKRMSHAS